MPLDCRWRILLFADESGHDSVKAIENPLLALAILIPTSPPARSFWMPSAAELRETERAMYEYLGLLALGLDHRGRE